jgi:uncharacterized protein with HEPN domain
MRRIVELLADARDHAQRASDYVDAIDYFAFTADQLRRDAVCFCLIAVGEACGQAARRTPTLPLEIPWTAIKAMRNILVHEFWQIDYAIVYSIARDDAALLAGDLNGLIDQLKSAKP